MPTNQRITDSQIEFALMKNFGNVTWAALELGVHPATVRSRVNGENRAKFAAVRYESVEQIKDMAEMGAFQHVMDRDAGMIKFVLPRLAKDRGWGNAVEHGGTVQLAVAPLVPADEIEDEERDALRQLLAERRGAISSVE